MGEKIRVLFICRHNSARSRMAEAFVENSGRDGFHAESAGFSPRPPLPTAAAVMAEIGIDITRHPSQSVFDLHAAGQAYDYVITVCDRDSAARCPVFPSPCRRLHWEFPEPSAFTGTEREILDRTRHVRDLIRARTDEWLSRIGKETAPK